MSQSRSRAFIPWAFAAFLCLSLGGCAAAKHGWSLNKYQGQVLQAKEGGGATRLRIEGDHDPAINAWLLQHGEPDYIHVKSGSVVEICYLDEDRVIVFTRRFGTRSEAEIVEKIPEKLSRFFTKADRERLAALRVTTPRAKTQSQRAEKRHVVPAAPSASSHRRGAREQKSRAQRPAQHHTREVKRGAHPLARKAEPVAIERARDLVWAEIGQNDFNLSKSDLRGIKNPDGDGVFVYVPQTRFFGVKRLFIWLVVGDRVAKLNGAANKLTPQLPWPREFPQAAWAPAGIDPIEVTSRGIGIAFGPSPKPAARHPRPKNQPTLASASPASASKSQRQILGEWNDNIGTIWKHNIKIIREGSRHFRVSTFGDGSTKRGELSEVKPKPGQQRAFKDIRSSHGEVYAIDRNGNLDLYDAEGFIREAKRVR